MLLYPFFLTEISLVNFMNYYRKEFSDASVTPKMHMMENHLIPQVQKWKFAMGFLGEQGAESIHASFNSIERSYVSIPNKVDRLLRVMQEHLLRIDPENRYLAPKLPKKKQL